MQVSASRDAGGALPPPMQALLVRAQALQRTVDAGAATSLLRGRNIAFVSASSQTAPIELFRRAAVGLGARVSEVRCEIDDDSPPQEVARTARMLGQLYDAIGCEGMSPALVRQIADEGGIPVFDGIAADDANIALAGHLDAAVPLDERRCRILQAVLLDAFD